MERIVHLLNEKNHYLDKFYTLNESELVRFVQGNYQGLDSFYESREKILQIIKYIDSEIDRSQHAMGEMMIEDETKQQVKTALMIKDQYVHKILEQDLQVLQCIETAKSGIIRELVDLKKNKKAVGGYKQAEFTK